MTEISFKDLPLYSYDYDADFPPAARAFKDAIASVDAVLFVTPEYNRSIPGGLKNAIDWARLINDDGEVTDDSVGEFLSNYMTEFSGFIRRVYTAIARTASA